MNKRSLPGTLLTIILLFQMLISGCNDSNNMPLDSTTGNTGNGSTPINDSTPNTGGTTNTNSCTDFQIETKPGGRDVNISGTLQFEDRDQNSSGFTGSTTVKPARFIDTEIVRCADSAVLASGKTNSTGSYSITFTNTGNAGVYLRILARIQPDSANPDLQEITVRNNTTDNAIHGIALTPFDETVNSTFSINATVSAITEDTTTALGGIFNLLDLATDMSAFVQGFGAENIPPLTIYWEDGSNDGTYYDWLDDSIHLLGVNDDRDEYDDDVFAHEYGHFIAVNYSRDDSPGGRHSLSDTALDIRLAWSEGWATFFAAALKNSPSVVDTSASGASMFEIETPSLSSVATYTTNELAISSVLWDVFDTSTDESFDTLAMGFEPIWDILTNYYPITANASMEDFFDAFKASFSGAVEQLLEITGTRKMEFFSDTSEDDSSTNTANTITVGGAPTHHTLYFSGTTPDTDYFKFAATSGTTYTISTLNLTNGADTYLELLQSNGTTLISSNDNSNGKSYSGCDSCPPNDTTTLASSITFSATNSSDIFIKAFRAPGAPASSGVYGSYDIQLRSP